MENKQSTTGPNFWFALGLIAVGLLFLLDNLGLLEIGSLWRYWPLVFVGVGILRLSSPAHHDRGAAAIFIGVGVALLLLNFDILEWSDIWQFWPLALILLGLSMIFGRHRHRLGPGNGDAAEADAARQLDVVAVFGGCERQIAARDFTGGSITAVCGGAKIDLRQAELAKGKNVIDIFAVCGGAEIYVPGDWHVELAGLPIFGGIEDARRQLPPESGAAEKTLVIKGLVLFGGLTVKNA